MRISLFALQQRKQNVVASAILSSLVPHRPHFSPRFSLIFYPFYVVA